MLEGWFFMISALLVLSGGIKLRDPEPTRGALRAVGLPSTGGAVAALAVAEITAGAGSVVLVSPIAPAAVAILYLGFSAFVAAALRLDLPIQSCGCFGRSDTPPGWGHVVVNLAAAGAAIAVASNGGTDILQILDSQPAGGIPYVGFVVLGAFLVGAILTDLPAASGRRVR